MRRPPTRRRRARARKVPMTGTTTPRDALQSQCAALLDAIIALQEIIVILSCDSLSTSPLIFVAIHRQRGMAAFLPVLAGVLRKRVALRRYFLSCVGI